MIRVVLLGLENDRLEAKADKSSIENSELKKEVQFFKKKFADFQHSINSSLTSKDEIKRLKYENSELNKELESKNQSIS